MTVRSVRYALTLAAAFALAGCLPDLIADAGPDQVVKEGAAAQ